ncbi:MAG TPA: glutamate-1-semialdehyde 2,1-aminomutase [bacterium]
MTGLGARAASALVGGVNSPVRACRAIGTPPLMLAEARGAHVRDADGREYVDLVMGWGPLILGHRPDAVETAVRASLERCDLLGFTHEDEIALAEAIRDATASVERVRLTVSGTEACMTALRLARAATGRRLALMFDGGYHGHSDALLGDASEGVPAGTAADLARVPYNDLAAFDRAMDERGAETACVIVEPVAANMGVIEPDPGFLARVRDRASRAGALVVFDEVVTGFRLGYGAAQARLGVAADLTVFGKIIGGGWPIGALGGPASLMRRLAPEGGVYHGGTFAGHPASAAAGRAVLESLRRNPPYDRLEQLGDALADGLARAAAQDGVPVRVNRAGSMLTVFFTDCSVRNLRDAAASDRERFGRWAAAMLEQGVLVAPSAMEAMFVSAAHTDADVARVIEAAGAAFARVRTAHGASHAGR